MKFQEYREKAARTMPGGVKDPDLQLAVYKMGLIGEVGEVVDLLKKHIGHGHPVSGRELAKEIGDCLWYIAALVTALGLDVTEWPSVPVRESQMTPMELTYKALIAMNSVNRYVWEAEGNFQGLHLISVLLALSAIADHFGVTLSFCAARNIEKLLERYPNGFSSAASKARKDVKGAA